MTNKSRRYLVVVPLVAIAAAAGIWVALHLSSPIGKIRHVLLISIDTCRADHLSCYGFSRPTTPTVDALAKEGVLFTNAHTHVPLTLPSHCSMLTGTIPPYHGVHDPTGFKLAQANLTLAEVTKEHGFKTGAVVGGFVLNSQFGLNQGFETYDDLAEPGAGGDVLGSERKGAEVSRAAIAWLDKHKADDFFLFVHYYDAHYDYAPPEPFASSFSGDPYAGEIAYVDRCIGDVVSKLKSLKLFDSTMIIVTADHGESLGEHGEAMHGYYVYEGVMRVPLVVKLPGSHRPSRVEDPVALIDIMPTVLRASGLAIPAAVQGRDLTPYLTRGKPADKAPPLYLETLFTTKFNLAPLLGVISEGWKYIHAPTPELYNLAKDPGEKDNLVAKEPERANELKETLRKLLEEKARKVIPPDGVSTVDQQTVERLSALGYVGGRSASGTAEFNAKGEDPKDFAPLYNAFMLARGWFSAGEYARAREACEKLVTARPDFYDAYDILGQVALAEGRTEEAIEYFTRHIKGVESGQAGETGAGSGPRPEEAAAHERLGTLLSRANRVEEAVTQFEALARLRPDDASAHSVLAAAMMWQGKAKESIPHWREVVRLRPDRPDGYNHLAEALLLGGDRDGAIAAWKETIRLAPEQPAAQLNLGSAVLRTGKPADAIPYLSAALRGKPDWPKAQRLLGQAYFELGQFDKAFATWEDGLRKNGSNAELLQAYAWGLANCSDAKLRNPARAVSLAEKARDAARGPNPSVYQTLAMTYAAAGRFPQAVKAADQAIQILTDAGHAELTEVLRRQRDQYKAGKPLEPSAAAAPLTATSE